MVEKTDRTAESTGPRSADGRRFEVFVRGEESEPLRHVGTVAAPTPDAAHEEASKLFAWYARDVWVCPAEETHRYSAESLACDDRPTDGESASGDDGEPRVFEETEGTPTVACGGTPVEETPTEDVPADDASTEDVPADDASTEDVPADDASTNDVPADDAPEDQR